MTSNSSSSSSISSASSSSISSSEIPTRKIKNKCKVCQSPARLLCSGCRLMYYCSAKCQKEDWKIHKPTCIMFKLETDEEIKANKQMRKGVRDTPPEEGKVLNMIAARIECEGILQPLFRFAEEVMPDRLLTFRPSDTDGRFKYSYAQDAELNDKFEQALSDFGPPGATFGRTIILDIRTDQKCTHKIFKEMYDFEQPKNGYYTHNFICKQFRSTTGTRIAFEINKYFFSSKVKNKKTAVKEKT